MPELVKLEEELTEDVGLIGILTDGINKDSALEIVNEVGLNMPQILMNEEIYQSLTEVMYIPYIYFVDSSGKVIGEELTGKQSLDDLKQAIDDVISETK